MGRRGTGYQRFTGEKASEARKRRVMINKIRKLEEQNPEWRQQFSSYHGYEKANEPLYMSDIGFQNYLTQLYNNPFLVNPHTKGSKQLTRMMNMYSPSFRVQQGRRMIRDIREMFQQRPDALRNFNDILKYLQDDGYKTTELINEFVHSKYYVVLSIYDTAGLEDFNNDYDIDITNFRFLDFLVKEKGIDLPEELYDIYYTAKSLMV